jgi:cell division protein ZapA (FtsZ GTPase activity inhibitor)
MALVNISIRNCDYQVACNDGEEANVKNLADSLARRIDKLAINYAKANDSLLLLIAALTVEDEIEELKRKKSLMPLTAKPQIVRDEVAIDENVAQALDAISEYVETLARKINNL